jgi:hypothetical protein
LIKTAKKLLKFLFIVILGLYVFYFLLFQIPQWRVLSLIREYKKNPSQEAANRLARLLDRQAVSSKQGSEILRLLMTPIIIKRESYSVRKPAFFQFLPRFDVQFSRMNLDRGGDAQIENVPQWATDKHDEWIESAISEGNEYTYGPDSPGEYILKINFEYRLYSGEFEGYKWPGEGNFPKNIFPRYLCDSQNNPSYKCNFTVPIELNFMEENKAEKIALIADPSIKNLMKAAFQIRVCDKHLYGENGGTTTLVKGLIEFYYIRTPTDAAFNITYIDKAGKEYPLRSSFWALKEDKKNSLKQIYIAYKNLPIENEGIFEGTLFFRSDPETALRNPKIKSIWDGTLEFPIKFEVIKK